MDDNANALVVPARQDLRSHLRDVITAACAPLSVAKRAIRARRPLAMRAHRPAAQREGERTHSRPQAPVTISDTALQRMLDDDPGGPVYLLNLLRFKPDGGRELYAKYLAEAGKIAPRYGAELVYVGEGEPALIGDDEHHWDRVLISRYPSRQAFAALIRAPDYQAIVHLHRNALTEAVLQPTRPATP
jgi:uncharacterized protein (DUF1330 family)